MKFVTIYFIMLFTLISCNGNSQNPHISNSNDTIMKLRELTDFEKSVIIDKGTERPFVGEYTDVFDNGVYECKQCGNELYTSSSKFHSNCGWPSFDDEIAGAVTRIPDADGRRVEIVCAKCSAHLGHVFEGEGFTEKNTRHCVNSVSMIFKPLQNSVDTAYFASGCFWGTEYWFERAEGVIKTNVGYTGGTVENPTYEQVCSGNTGHAEAVQVVFNPQIITYKELLTLYFNTHDPSQVNRQGPDIGEQYRSEIFYINQQQKTIADELLIALYKKGIEAATEVTQFRKFYVAEEYHQQYYTKNKKQPYCHVFKNKF